MKRSHVFEADDGTTFPTAEECKKYEEKVFFGLLHNLGGHDIEEALNRTNIKLADAFELVGNIIANKRRESGEFRRAKSETSEALADPSGEKAGKLLAEKLDKRRKGLTAVT